MTSAPTAPSAPPSPLRIYLHSTLLTSHTLHGPAQEDYAQYSSYCTRRLSRLRHNRDVKKELLHCRQYKGAYSTRDATNAPAAGKGGKHAYRPIDMTNVPSPILASHVNFFLEPLYCAERCWASSLHFKALASGGGDGREGSGNALGGRKKEVSPGKLRAQSIKRLRKAVKYATLLETLTLSRYAGPVGAEGEEDGEATKEGDGAAPPVDEHTQMEAWAYASWMRGNLALEQNQWQVAYAEYQTAMTLCQKLAISSNGSGGDGKENQNGQVEGNDGNSMQQLEMFDFFTTRAHSVIAPLLKYCHYELKENGMSPDEKISFLQESQHSNTSSNTANDPLQSKLLSLKTETLQNQATSGSNMSQLIFRENTIVVETKELRMALLKIQDLKEDWEAVAAKQTHGNAGKNDSKLMALLSGYDDAMSLANKELKQLAALKSGPAVNAKKFQLVNILGYVKYQKLKLLMARNEGLVNGILKGRSTSSGKGDNGKKKTKKELTLKQLEEVAHLYDALLQDARAVASLPGGGSLEDFDPSENGSTAVVEDEFLLEANANILRLRALRCYYLGRMHSSPLVHKYPEAVALLDQAESLASEALEEIAACDKMEGGDEMLEHLEKVVGEIKGEKCRVVAVSYLNKKASFSSSSSSSQSASSLLHRLHSYEVPSNPTKSIASVPPKLEPMVCKPSFFDVALNYISEYPVEELESAMEECLGKKDSGVASTGILGWFRRG
mmetsp:Transcript_10193/g.21284  ORF Transcript_10193/g.21284 Transcript_10193/m.21284 type:complete len:727 (-) Transcript_10193:75-2255(-)